MIGLFFATLVYMSLLIAASAFGARGFVSCRGRSFAVPVCLLLILVGAPSTASANRYDPVHVAAEAFKKVHPDAPTFLIKEIREVSQFNFNGGRSKVEVSWLKPGHLRIKGPGRTLEFAAHQTPEGKVFEKLDVINRNRKDEPDAKGDARRVSRTLIRLLKGRTEAEVRFLSTFVNHKGNTKISGDSYATVGVITGAGGEWKNTPLLKRGQWPLESPIAGSLGIPRRTLGSTLRGLASKVGPTRLRSKESDPKHKNALRKGRR